MPASTTNRNRTPGTRTSGTFTERDWTHKDVETPGSRTEEQKDIRKLDGKIETLNHFFEKGEFKDIIENYGNMKKRLFNNFTAGLARGLGMTLGTALVIGLLGWLLSMFIDMPVIGKYIADLQDYINAYK
ncbi:DUF5665 domain-containing protein [Paenibacillus gansuensis]|uniref:DUF5665 domain-containing protein n=1 Tax=Paenibacillus gansuensis TaxID=306542 RepID=A0ABW5PCD2_9BACL